MGNFLGRKVNSCTHEEKHGINQIYPSENTSKMTMVNYSNVATIFGGLAGVGFIGYCIYFDRKRRSDPNYRDKVRQRREAARKSASSSASSIGDLPDLKDQEAVQKFFLDEVSKGEQYLAEQKFELCVKHLTNAIAVCGQPQQLLQVFRNMLPPNVFQMLISNLALLGSAQMNQMKAAGVPTEAADIDGDTEGLD